MCCKALGVTEELQGVLLCLCIKVQTFDDMDQVLEISTTSVIWTLQKWTGSRHNREVSTFLWFSLYNSVIENYRQYQIVHRDRFYCRIILKEAL